MMILMMIIIVIINSNNNSIINCNNNSNNDNDDKNNNYSSSNDKYPISSRWFFHWFDNCRKETAEATSRGVLFCLLKKVFLKLPQISPENNFIKTTLLKKDSNTGVFLWNLQKFKNTYFEEHLRTTASRTEKNLHRILLKILFLTHN